MNGREETNATSEQPKLVDKFGRQVTYVRISVTDRCDFRCVYCMDEEMSFLPREDILSLEEIALVAKAFSELGVSKIRLTGGEPLIRKNVMSVIKDIGELPIPFTFDLEDRSAIAKFLTLNDMVEPIMDARGVDAAAILHQKRDFIVASVAADMKEDLAGATRRDLRRLGRQYAERLPQAWQGLAALVRWAEEDGPWPTITSEHPAYFYTLRAKSHLDADLVNMLLAELTPLDIRQLFICHKEVFYRAYADWPDEKRAYVVDFLDREYQVDKAGTRDALFGHEAPMMEMPRVTQPDLISRVGPWGAVARGRS